MTHQNLVLTEKAIGRHTKRLQKELSKINHDLKLSEAQNMLSRILGMKDYHELKQVLKFDKKEEEEEQEKGLEYYLDRNNFITLEYAEQNLEKFFVKGSISIILDFLNSNNPLIQNHIKENAINYFNIAGRNNQLYLLKTLISKRLVDLNSLTEKEIESLYQNLLSDNIESLDSFVYIFYDLNFPNELSQNLVGSITHKLINLVNVQSIKTHLHNFLYDNRVYFQREFFWNKCPVRVIEKDSNNIETIHTKYDLSFCSLNSVCVKGDLEIVKYLIEKQNVLPLEDGSTVSRACLSGNLDLVKYLINDVKAPFNYFQKNNYKKISDNDMTYHLDFSTLSSAVKSGKLELVEYLINYKKLVISDYDFLALRVALIESSDIYKYFIKIPECIEYIKTNSQLIFNEVISKIHYNGKINNENNYKKLQENQFQIACELLQKYSVEVDEVVTVNNNSKLIEMLEKYKFNNIYKYFQEGNISIILNFLQSNNTIIKEYIMSNINFLCYLALKNNQLVSCSLLENANIFNFSNLKEEYIEDILLTNFDYGNGSTFNKVFYSWNLPQNLTKENYQKLLNKFNEKEIYKTRKDKFLKDKRVLKYL